MKVHIDLIPVSIPLINEFSPSCFIVVVSIFNKVLNQLISLKTSNSNLMTGNVEPYSSSSYSSGTSNYGRVWIIIITWQNELSATATLDNKNHRSLLRKFSSLGNVFSSKTFSRRSKSKIFKYWTVKRYCPLVPNTLRLNTTQYVSFHPESWKLLFHFISNNQPVNPSLRKISSQCDAHILPLTRFAI